MSSCMFSFNQQATATKRPQDALHDVQHKCCWRAGRRLRLSSVLMMFGFFQKANHPATKTQKDHEETTLTENRPEQIQRRRAHNICCCENSTTKVTEQPPRTSVEITDAPPGLPLKVVLLYVTASGPSEVRGQTEAISFSLKFCERVSCFYLLALTLVEHTGTFSLKGPE